MYRRKGRELSDDSDLEVCLIHRDDISAYEMLFTLTETSWNVSYCLYMAQHRKYLMTQVMS